MDLLIIVTNRAMCEHAGLSVGCEANDANKAAIQGELPVLASQTNSAMQSVGVAAEIRIVRTIYLQPGYDGRPNRETLEVIRTNSDIQQWRDDAGADLVASK